MTTSRVGCAARSLYQDKHQCVERWYVVTDPAGQTFDLCSGACLVEYATLGALPATDVAAHSGPADDVDTDGPLAGCCSAVTPCPDYFDDVFQMYREAQEERRDRIPLRTWRERLAGTAR
jgi:hypothetical protein